MQQVNYIPAQKEAIQAITWQAKTNKESIKQLEPTLYIAENTRLFRVHQTKTGSSIHYYIHQPRIRHIATHLKTNHAEPRQALANATGVNIGKVKEVSAPFFEIDDPGLNGYSPQHNGLYIVKPQHEQSELIKNAIQVEDYIQSTDEKLSIFKIE